MGIVDPSGFSFLTNLMNQVGGNAQLGLNSKPTGLKTMKKQGSAFDNAPPTVLPGGGVLDKGIQSQTARELLPSEELPLYQNQRQFDIGLAGTEAGAANLGAETEQNSQQYRQALMSIIGPMLIKLGISPSVSSAATGGGGFLMKLLSGGSI